MQPPICGRTCTRGKTLSRDAGAWHGLLRKASYVVPGKSTYCITHRAMDLSDLCKIHSRIAMCCEFGVVSRLGRSGFWMCRNLLPPSQAHAWTPAMPVLAVAQTLPFHGFRFRFGVRF